VEITESNLNAPPLNECSTKAIKGWEFPKISVAAPFTYPFEFSPRY